ncbi:hypothetical protein QUW15_03710 [Desulfovibrio piger]|nr:hypothetical protein [Desulfovibrio piger]
MKKTLLSGMLFLSLLLAGCGNSIQDAVEDLEVAEGCTLIEMLEDSDLIDDYKIKVKSDDLLRGEVAILIKLKNDAIIDAPEKNTILKLAILVWMSQTERNNEWDLVRLRVHGQLIYEDRTKDKVFNVHPSVLIKLAENKKITMNDLRDAADFYLEHYRPVPWLSRRGSDCGFPQA